MAHYKLHINRFTQARESTNVHSSGILISKSMDQLNFSVVGALPLSMHEHIRIGHPCQGFFVHKYHMQIPARRKWLWPYRCHSHI